MSVSLISRFDMGVGKNLEALKGVDIGQVDTVSTISVVSKN